MYFSDPTDDRIPAIKLAVCFRTDMYQKPVEMWQEFPDGGGTNLFVDRKGQARSITSGWLAGRLTIPQLASHIQAGNAFGHVWGPGTNSRGKKFPHYKNQSTWQGTQYLAFDIDGADDYSLLDHPIFREHFHFYYHTPSHGKKPGVRYRPVLPLAEPITDRVLVKQMMELGKRIAPGVDTSVMEVARHFWGGNGDPVQFHPGELLTEAKIRELIAQYAIELPEERVNLGRRTFNSPSHYNRTLNAVEEALVFMVNALLEKNMGEEVVSRHLFGDISLAFEDGMIKTYNGYEAFRNMIYSLLSMGIEEDDVALLLEEYWVLSDVKKSPAQYVAMFSKDYETREALGGTLVSAGYFWKLTEILGYSPPTWDELDPAVFGLNKVIADVQINRPFLQFDDIAGITTKCVMIKSPKGSGKTSVVAELASNFESVISIGHLRTLVGTSGQNNMLDDYREVVPAESQRLAITWQSTFRLEPKNQHFELVILDEFDQAMWTWTGKTMEGRQDRAMNRLRWLVDTAATIVIMDADLSQDAVEFMARLVGREQITVIENTFKPADLTFEFYPDRADIFAEAIGGLKAGKKLFIPTNGSVEANEALFSTLREEFPGKNGAIIHSGNSSDEDVQHNLKPEHIKDWVRELDYLITSPSLGSGFDINVEHFDQVLLIGEAGVNSHLDLLQQVARVRKIGDKTVKCWISPEQKDKEVDPDRLAQWCVQNAEETKIRLAMDNEYNDTAADQDYLFMWSRVTSRRNKSLNRLKHNFKLAVKQDGHKVVYMEGDRASRRLAKGRVREAKDRIKEERASAIVAAAEIVSLDYNMIKTKYHHTQEEKLSLVKYEIGEFYCEEVNSTLVALDEDGSFRDNIIQAELTAQIVDPLELDYRESRVRLDMAARKGKDKIVTRSVPLPHMTHHTVRADLINEILMRAGLPEWRRRASVTWAESERISKQSLTQSGFTAWVDAPGFRERSIRELGIKVPENAEEYGVQYVAQVLGLLGLSLTAQRRRVEGREIREYRVDRESLAMVWHTLTARAKRRAELYGLSFIGVYDNRATGNPALQFAESY